MGKFVYPPVGFRFNVTIDSNTDEDNSFSEVSGISAQRTTEEIIEGGENRFKHRLPSQVSYTPLVLKRGAITERTSFFDWIEKSMGDLISHVELKNITVSLLDEQNKTLILWTFNGAYPVKVDYAGFKSDSSQILIESIELSYNYFTMAHLGKNQVESDLAEKLKAIADKKR